MRAQVGHCDSSLSSSWRDDAPQVICISFHDFLDGAQLPCLILRHLLEGFLYSVKSTFRGVQFSSENAFAFFSVPSFQRKESPFHHSVSTISIIAALHLLQVLPGWRFMLPLALHSCLPFFLSILSELFYSKSFAAKICPHLSYVLLFSIIFHNLPRCAFFVCKNSYHYHFLNGLSPLATRNSLQHCWRKLVVYDSSPSFITTDVNCQKLRVFSLHRLSQRKKAFAER